MPIMKTTATSFLLATLLATTLALPTEEINERGVVLEKRGNPPSGKSRSDPKTVEVNVDGWAQTAEFDCSAMLCGTTMAGEHVYQRQPSQRAAAKAYSQESRASKQPFKYGGQYGGEPINSQTTSPEDAPPRSLQVPGGVRYVAPTLPEQQPRQGNALKQAYRHAEGGQAGPSEYVYVNFVGKTLGVCCQAFQKRDFTACTDGRCAGGKNRDDLFEDDINIEDHMFHPEKQGRGFNFVSGFKKRDATEDSVMKSGFFDRNKYSGDEIVEMLTEINRKRDEEDARQAQDGVEISNIEKRSLEDDYIAAGFELDLADLD